MAQWYQSQYYPHASSSYVEEDRFLPLDSYEANMSCVTLEGLKQMTGKDPAGMRMLDMGCGTGYFLRNFRSAGLDVYATDFSDDIVKSHTPSLIQTERFQAGDILKEDFFKGMRFEFILVKNVLEHVLEPKLCLRKIKQYLSRDGICCLIVPNDFTIIHDKYLNGNAKESAAFFLPPDHLSYFNTKTLPAYLKRNGFTVVDLFCDYPIEHHLLHPASNYYENKEFGPVAGALRVRLIDMLVKQSTAKALNLFRSFFENGIGRNIYTFVKLEKPAVQLK